MRFYCSIIVALFSLLVRYPVYANSSMEKVILSPYTNLTNVLAGKNKIYVIQHDYDLKGKSVHIGYNSILLFQGGSIRNGIIEGDNTYIDSAPVKIFSNDTKFTGTFKNQSLYTEWFGAVGDDKNKAKDNTDAFNAAIKAAIGTNSTMLDDALKCVNCITLLNSTYYIDGRINVPSAYFKITSNGITSIGYVNHKMPAIEQLADAPVICFTDRKIDEIHYGEQLTHVIIENVKINGSSIKRSLYGIGKERCTSFNSCEFKNILVSGFRYGCYFNLTATAGVYNNLFENVTISGCVLGLYIKTDRSNSNWMNINNFKRCWFVKNHNCGLVIGRMMNQSVANLYETCTFEANGEGYDMADYLEYGVSGATILGGQAEFHNCYFESNYASRASNNSLKDGETTFKEGGVGENFDCGVHIEPKILNDREGNLVLGPGHVRLIDCSITIGHRLITCSSISPQLEIQGCNISNRYLNSKTSDAIVNYLVDENGNKNSVNLKINGLCKKSEEMSNQLKYAYRITGELNQRFPERFSTSSDIDIDVTSIESIITAKERNQLGVIDVSSVFYVDNKNGNDRNTGTNPANSFKTLIPLRDILSIDKNKSIRVVFMKDYVVTENMDLITNEFDRIEFSSINPYNPVQINLKTKMFGIKMRYGIGKIVFRDINFICDAPLVENPKAECRWYFDNCSLFTNGGVFFKCTEGKQEVYFKECNFNTSTRLNFSDNSMIQSSGEGEVYTKMIDCQTIINR